MKNKLDKYVGHVQSMKNWCHIADRYGAEDSLLTEFDNIYNEIVRGKDKMSKTEFVETPRHKFTKGAYSPKSTRFLIPEKDEGLFSSETLNKACELYMSLYGELPTRYKKND